MREFSDDNNISFGMSILCTSPSTPCHNSNSGLMMPGYYCQTGECYRCPSGYFGSNGLSCTKCPYGTASFPGSFRCGTAFNFSSPGFRKLHIPEGINKINVRMWGGGGGGGQSGNKILHPASSGGGAGFVSCNISVSMDSNIFILTAGGANKKFENFAPNFRGILLTCYLRYSGVFLSASFDMTLDVPLGFGGGGNSGWSPESTAGGNACTLGDIRRFSL
jgi:hypothetical protein